MRIRQVQTLVWIGNVLVLAGAGWVAWGFVQTKKAQSGAGKAEWPEVPAKPMPSVGPGDAKGFEHIWKTPVDGQIPPPPEVKIEKPVQVDPAVEFKNKLQITGGMVGSSVTTSIQFTFDGQAKTLRLGETIDGVGKSWQFIRFEWDRNSGTANARFVSGDLDVLVSQKPPGLKPLTDDETKKFVAEFAPGGPIDPNAVREDKIQRPAFLDRATGEWTVTSEEALWWETFGESAFFVKLAAKTETDAEGKPRGVRLMTVPSPPALAGGRGILQGDLIVSINKVPVRELTDVVAYLRGDGRCLERYDVVVERDGAQKALVYKVERRGAVSGRP